MELTVCELNFPHALPAYEMIFNAEKRLCLEKAFQGVLVDTHHFSSRPRRIPHSVGISPYTTRRHTDIYVNVNSSMWLFTIVVMIDLGQVELVIRLCNRLRRITFSGYTSCYGMIYIKN
jgi:hypothetical protein